MKKERKRVAYGEPYQRVGIPRGRQDRESAALARTLTEAQINKVRAHAVEHGLHALMVTCDRALGGSTRARLSIARWVKTGALLGPREG